MVSADGQPASDATGVGGADEVPLGIALEVDVAGGADEDERLDSVAHPHKPTTPMSTAAMASGDRDGMRPPY